MSVEKESYHICIQLIEALSLQLLDITYYLEDIIDFVNYIKDRTSNTHFISLQQLALRKIVNLFAYMHIYGLLGLPIVLFIIGLCVHIKYHVPIGLCAHITYP